MNPTCSRCGKRGVCTPGQSAWSFLAWGGVVYRPQGRTRSCRSAGDGGRGRQDDGQPALRPAARPPGLPASGTEDRRSVVTDSPENGLAVRDALQPTTFVRTDPVFFSFQPCWARRRSVVTPIRRARAGRRSGFARGTQLAMAAGLPGLSLALVPSPWISGSRSMVHGHPQGLGRP